MSWDQTSLAELVIHKPVIEEFPCAHICYRRKDARMTGMGREGKMRNNDQCVWWRVNSEMEVFAGRIQAKPPPSHS